MERVVELQPCKVEYPPLTLWKSEIKDFERLKVINPCDFPADSIINGLGIGNSTLAKSFGICNQEEIEQRQSLMRFLIEYQEITDWICGQAIPFNLPTQAEDFLEFFDPEERHNPYWQKVRDFIGLLLKGSNLSSRLQTLAAVLESSLPLEDFEKKMVEIIADHVQNIAVIEGVMNFDVYFGQEAGEPKFQATGIEYIDSQTHGHRMYSFALNAAKKHHYPNWTQNKWNPLNWLGIGKLFKKAVDKMNTNERKKAYQDMVIGKASPGLISDISKGVLKELKQLRLNYKWHNVWAQVYFSYSKNGLKLQIYGLNSRIEKPHKSFEFDEYEGYSPERLKIIEKVRQECIEVIGEDRRSMENAKLRAIIREQSPTFFEEKFSVPSPNTDKEHRWFAITNLYESPALKATYQALKEHRDFFEKQIDILYEVSLLATRFQIKAKELGASICYPEILGNGHHLIAFEEIFPIHLLFRPDRKKLVPIKNLPQINGQMIGLTGYHGGGKTVTSLSIIDNIFLAQSGLPVFGRGFRLNIKEVLGMVFIERGEGSTCELLLKKIKTVLEGIQGVDGSKIVLVLDELGTGTQEASGLELGRDLLSKLGRSKISVLFSTQITSLAEFASKNLNTQCFKFDANHKITPGIGKGGMEDLRERIGLNKLLN